jgi:MYND finger
MYQEAATLLSRVLPPGHQKIQEMLDGLSRAQAIVGSGGTEAAGSVEPEKNVICCNPDCNVPLIKDELMTCSGCGSVCYCSKACQVVHWKLGHKKACKKSQAEKARAGT